MLSGKFDMARALAVEDVTGRIYDAAADPALWPDAVAAIADIVGCRSGIFYEHDLATQRSSRIGVHRLDPGFMRDYESYVGALDPWNKRAKGLPAGIAGPTYALISDHDLRRTEFYSDHLRPIGVFYGLGGVVDRLDGKMAVFGVQRSYEDGHFPPEAQEIVGKIMPHLRRAYRLDAAIRHTRRHSETLEETLHLMQQPVLVVDRDVQLVFANRAAELLLAAHDGLKLVAGKLAAAHRGDQAALAAVLRVGPALDPADSMITLRRPDRRPPLIVRAVPLRRANRAEWTGQLALLIEMPSAVPRGLGDLPAAFHLSAAEANLWTCLVLGQTLAEIAEHRNVSVNTLRVQLAALFRKVGVHRQADLVRLALEARSSNAEDHPTRG
jgi:DNA-binding CsgD family transcriptional regulator